MRLGKAGSAILTAGASFSIGMLGACTSSSPAEVQLDSQRRVYLAGQLAQLDALSRPVSVPAADWDALKGALAAAIEVQLADLRSASIAPVSDAARTELEFDLDADIFTWRYYNPGDYDQNGEVNISDLTPLAVHLNEAVPAGPDGGNSIVSVVDGDGNGVVTIADITPLGANLGKRVTAFNLYAAPSGTQYPASNSAESTIASFASVLVTPYGGERNAERVYYSLAGSLLDPALEYWIRPVDVLDGTEGTPSPTLERHRAPEPGAALNATPLTGTVPQLVTLDASASVNGLEYAWDPEGDGSFIEGGASSTFEFTYSAAQVYNPVVRVGNGGGVYRTASIAVNLQGTPQWHNYPIELQNLNDNEPGAIACGVHGGVPYVVLSYGQLGGIGRMGWLNATSPVGNSWQLIDTYIDSRTGRYNRIKTTSIWGQPAYVRAFSNPPLRNLKYARAGAAFPETNWSDFVDIYETSTAPFPISTFSFKQIGNWPAVAWQDSELETMRFTSGTDNTGSSFFTSEFPVPGTDLGYDLSLIDMDGKPAIAYTQAGGGLSYVDAADFAVPADWNTPVTIDTGSCAMDEGLVRLADGSPAVVYNNYDSEQMLFRRASSASGDLWITTRQLAPTDASAGYLPSAIMVGEIAHAFWRVPGVGDLLHCQAMNASADEWTAPELVAEDVDFFVTFAAFDLDGRPAVGYATTVSNQFHLAVQY